MKDQIIRTLDEIVFLATELSVAYETDFYSLSKYTILLDLLKIEQQLRTNVALIDEVREKAAEAKQTAPLKVPQTAVNYHPHTVYVGPNQNHETYIRGLDAHAAAFPLPDDPDVHVEEVKSYSNSDREGQKPQAQ